ncbi:MAG: NAD-dependent epimerase/dehydratase family protein [Rubricoccaceae bacterium]|nr:NAD-dependent epimerase/dehydratase family protein [Rubricoccaceae bacterium]
MKTFVTGGTGFVGSHLVETLLERGHDVTSLVRKDSGWLNGRAVTTVQGDLFDVEALAEGMRGAEIVYHVAGLTRAPSRTALDRTNVDGTLNVLQAARNAGVERALVTSSLAAVGPSGDGALDEGAPLNPISNYGRSKAEMERMVRELDSGPPVVIVRPPAVYGPREADFFTLIRAASKQRVLPVIGDGNEPRVDLVYISDLVDGMIAAAEADKAGGQTYFLSGPRGYSDDEIRRAILDALGHGAININVPPAFVDAVGAVSEEIGKLFGKYPLLNREKAREASSVWLVSSERAKSDFGYSPEVSLEEGMRRTVAWYRENGWL